MPQLQRVAVAESTEKGDGDGRVIPVQVVAITGMKGGRRALVWRGRGMLQEGAVEDVGTKPRVLAKRGAQLTKSSSAY